MLQDIQNKLTHLKDAAATLFKEQLDEASLYQAKVQFLGKKGQLTDILKELGKLSNEERPIVGGLANQVKSELELLYASLLEKIQLQAINEKLTLDRIDVTLPAVGMETGHVHPVSAMLSDIKDVFRRMGFDIHEGPEIETDYYNFEALNIPSHHPARDMQDTFYLGPDVLLRTHTSPVQMRVMEKQKPPIYMVAPGTVYRCDSDVTHTPMFHQIEGLVVDRGANLPQMKAVVSTLLEQIFKKELKVRFRPSFFPFTEPSAEVDIGCVLCDSKGCRVCKNTGWLEVMGCGMVHPQVFHHAGIDPEEFTGFAFGLGIERVTMLKHGIGDLRLFYENDLRFLKQF